MEREAIRIESLTRSFGPVVAIDGLTLSVPCGVVFGFLGTNGAGKTTTIRLLLGLLAPSGGSAAVLGLDVRTQAAAIRGRCGALLEQHGLYERLSAADNLEFYGRISRLTPAERAGRARDLLTHFGLWERRHERVGAWSRGMKQKLAIARALLARPELVFLDEPTDGLDPVAASALRTDITALAAGGATTVFLTTHNLAEAEQICTQVAIISSGKLLAVGRTDDLRARAAGPQLEIIGDGVSPPILRQIQARPEVRQAVLDNRHLRIELRDGNTQAQGAALVAALVAAGVSVEEVRRGAPSLEQAFLALVEGRKAGAAASAPPHSRTAAEHAC